MPNAVYASVNPMKPAGLQPPQDAVLVDSRAKHLAGPNDAMLPSGDFRNHGVGLGAFLSHIESKSPGSADSPPPAQDTFFADFGIGATG